MNRKLIWLMVGVFLFASCSEETSSDTRRLLTTTTPPLITTTTSVPEPTPTTAPPPTATTPRTEFGAAGIGDSLFPLLGNQGYDVDHYSIDLTFDGLDPELIGVVTIEATATEELPEFNLDFVGFEIDELSVDSAGAGFTRQNGELTVKPNTPIAAGDGFTVEVVYQGQPTPVESGFGSLGWLDNEAGDRYVLAEPNAASSWFPSNDHPSDKATYLISITAPASLLAIANGTLAGRTVDGDSVTYVYEMVDPMASYLATVVIGDFEVVDDAAATSMTSVPIRNVLRPELAANPPPTLSRQGEMMDFLESIFGPYPFDNYGVAMVPGVGSALETQTLSVVDEAFAISPELEFVLVHELAHQWVGNSVSVADWTDIWLNEGFATYANWLWIEHNAGAAALTNIVDVTRSSFAEAPHSPPGSPEAETLFAPEVYQLGALTLHALRLEIGDEAFFETLRRYATEFAGSNVRTEDFIALAEEESGDDLDGLFEAWLYGSEIPEI